MCVVALQPETAAINLFGALYRVANRIAGHCMAVVQAVGQAGAAGEAAGQLYAKKGSRTLQVTSVSKWPQPRHKKPHLLLCILNHRPQQRYAS